MNSNIKFNISFFQTIAAMADDGMLLNFELPSDAFAVQKTFKGGNWKDRLTARKSAQWGRQKAQDRATGGAKSIPDYGEVHSEDEELIHAEQRPSKRARTGERPQAKAAGTGPRIPKEPHRGDILPKTTTGEVISSLFTYNPSTADKVPPPATTEVDETPIEPSNAPLSDELATFTNLGLSQSLASHLFNRLNIRAPTAIQRKAVQQLCAADTDAFIQAETGSGKTLAYLLPIVQRIADISKAMKAAGQDFSRESGLFALILAPTRELSKQISTVLESLLSCCHWIVSGIVIGGEKKKSEKARLRKGLNILVATPGRLADHLNSTEVLDVSTVRWLVMDEGDRLMELGFEEDIQKIVSVLNIRGTKRVSVPGLPERRTTVLCSATIKSDVEQLRSIALEDPVSIAVDASEFAEDGVAVEQAFSAPSQLKQSYAIVPAKQRLVTLVAVLRQAFKRRGTCIKCIVFISAADSVDFHFEMLSASDGSGSAGTDGQEEERMPGTKLSRTGKIPQGNSIAETRTQGIASAISTPGNDDIRVFRLHGSLQQVTRTATLKAFAACETPAVLVATDVMARGLDLPNVDLVVEYDPPASKEDHLHRIGRTARAGKDGRAMIFLMPGCEEGYVEVLKEGKPKNLTRHDGDELLKKAFALTAGVVGVSTVSWEQAATEWQLDLERRVAESPRLLEQARRAFQSHVRAYATHVAAERTIFNMKDLHLGHLAKAFGLRDKPGSIRVPGQRPSSGAAVKTKEARRRGAAAAGGKRKAGGGSAMEDVDREGVMDEREARRKMFDKVKNMGGASEFNLG